MSTIDDLPETFNMSYKSHSESIGFLGAPLEAEIGWVGPWSARQEFFDAAGANEETINYPGGITATRIVTLQHPDWEMMYAEGGRVTPLGKPSMSGRNMAYKMCRITVGFAARPFYNFGGDYPLVDLNSQSGADKVTRPGTAYAFPSDGLRLAQNVGVDVVSMDWNVTFHNVGVLDLATYTVLSGKVNSNTFYTPYGLILPGFVHYLGFSNQQTLSIGNNFRHSITHRFRWKSIEHNKIMRPDGTMFEAPETAGGDKLLSAADLNAIYV